jgi:protein-serine/threonine kinase
MALSERRKEDLRARWRQNETDYLREQRRKVDVSAFVKLQTIGHGECAGGSSIVRRHPNCRMLGAFGVVSLVRERSTGKLFAMKQVRVFLAMRHSTLSAVFVCPVTQDGYAEEGPGGPRPCRA